MSQQLLNGQITIISGHKRNSLRRLHNTLAEGETLSLNQKDRNGVIKIVLTCVSEEFRAVYVTEVVGTVVISITSKHHGIMSTVY